MAQYANELRYSETRSIEAMGFSEASMLDYLVEEFFHVPDRVQAAGAHGSKENQTLPCYRDRRRYRTPSGGGTRANYAWLDQTAAWTTANNLPAAGRKVSGFLRCARSAGGDRPDLSQVGNEDLL